MITLVLGGARSGKSEFAERLARAAGSPVTYIATATVTGDADFDRRVRLHRERRPAEWRTEEPGRDLVSFLLSDRTGSTLLVDSLGTWVASFDRFETDTAGLCRALVQRPGSAIVVSEEVGLGVHPSSEVGGLFRDALGVVNQAVADVADRAYLVVAGRGLVLESGV